MPWGLCVRKSLWLHMSQWIIDFQWCNCGIKGYLIIQGDKRNSKNKKGKFSCFVSFSSCTLRHNFNANPILLHLTRRKKHELSGKKQYVFISSVLFLDPCLTQAFNFSPKKTNRTGTQCNATLHPSLRVIHLHEEPSQSAKFPRVLCSTL